MKVVAVLLLATAVFGWDDQKVFKKWSGMKAMESCWGEDNMKTYTVQLKRAISKCHGTDAPELELPIYRSPFRFINTIMTSGQQHQEYLMEAVQKMAHNMVSEQNYNMQNMQQNNQFQGQQFQNQQNSQFQQQYMPKNQNQGRNDMYNMNPMNFQGQNDNMQSNNMKNMKYDQVMNTVSMMKFLKEYMQVHPMTSQDNYNMDNMVQRNTYSNQKDNTNQFSQELMRRMGGVQQKQNQFRFKREVNGDTKPQGSDANTLPGFLELGDRLAEKLKDTKEKAIAKMGNFTCVMKEMNVLTQENQINVRGMKQELEKFNMPSQWFKDHSVKNIDICYQMSEAVPQSVQADYNYPGFPNLAKMKVFMKCCKETKQKTCMHQDMKNKIENNFGPLEKILEQTGLTETELFPLMMSLLHSSEEMEYM
jgi:hypothetical protein